MLGVEMRLISFGSVQPAPQQSFRSKSLISVTCAWSFEKLKVVVLHKHIAIMRGSLPQWSEFGSVTIKVCSRKIIYVVVPKKFRKSYFQSENPPKKQKILGSTELLCLLFNFLNTGLPRKAEMPPETPQLWLLPAKQQWHFSVQWIWFLHQPSRRPAFMLSVFSLCVEITALTSRAGMSSTDEYQCQSNTLWYHRTTEWLGSEGTLNTI